ncbi:baculoviral IAP repeat-containing protein 3-like [Littorina saxatilis]|uniref:baculoviral IAP repeat-containing protein 3-like n=1 Tax=Littorina saxatilis TaxID=31220 RepID=UPI0038B4FB26
MDTSHVHCLTPEVRRLITFQLTPLPNDRNLSFSNSPAKLARAGFQRGADARNDEVMCSFCKITYGDWEGESPFAVHRVLNELCPFLSTPSPEDAVQRHPRVLDARRRLFQTNDESDNHGDDSGYYSRLEESTHSPAPSYVSVLSPEASFSFPFHPKVGDASLLFASRRLRTFTEPGCKLCARWAEEGFVYRPDTDDVQCVFCEVVFPFDSFEVRELHADNSSACPRVLMKDVGNITVAVEERIRLKHLQWQLKKKEPQMSYAICHPQYEEESIRTGTFENWPKLEAKLEADDLSKAGFFFTGCADKVKCYCCGVGLYKWCQGACPWEQHALHMPACPHLQSKGHNFIQLAAQAQVLTEADLPPSTNVKECASSTGDLVTSPPGSLTMDMCAVTAALTTSQYSVADIRQAVLTYFFHTSKFPTKDILLGQLRAADVNFTDLCKQREANFQKDTQLQEKRKTQEQTQKDTALEQTHTVVEQHVQTIQQRDEELQFHREALRSQEAELEQKEAELSRQSQELERKRRLMAYQERQISALQLQMQTLLAHRRQADQQGNQAAPVQAAANNAAAVPAAPNAAAQNNNMTCDIRCKVCLSAESNTIFQPCCHITCCKTCAEELISEVCPVCRTPISDVLPAYIS